MYAYTDMDKTEMALAMCDSAGAVDSNNYYYLFYKGWNLIKAGKPKQGLRYCKLTYERDSTVQGATINYGHALFLRSMKEEANRIYKKAFENMESPSSFYSGLVADFNYFIEKGDHEEEFKELKKYYLTYYQENYASKLLLDSLTRRAKKLREKEEYTAAADVYRIAEGVYMRNPDKFWDEIRMMNRWTAYCYYKNTEYKRSLGFYKKAADITKKHGLGDDNLVQDYTDISHLYDWLNDTLKTMEFESRAASIDVALKEKRDAKNLYILGIGTTASGHNDSFANNDIQEITEKMQQGASLWFDGVTNKTVTGKKATIAAVKQALDSAIYNLTANDVFVLYYAGWGKLKGEELLSLSDGDMSLKELAGYLSQIPAGRQIHIADCNGLNWRKWYQNDNFGLLANEKKSLVFMGMKNARIEETVMKHSILTYALLNAWETSITSGNISASQWVATASRDLLENNKMYAVEMQTFGHDFIIGKSKTRTKFVDTIKPVIELFGAAVTRGGSNIAIISNRNVNTGSIIDDSKIVYAAVNGIRIVVAENGRFELPKELIGVKTIVIEAEDMFGNRAHREFLVSVSDNSVSQNGIRYAYLFASQDYQYWTDLTNPLDDAKSIGDILKENFGYEVNIIPNPSKKTIAEKLSTIRRFNYGPNDQLLVFFAGHGLYDTVFGGYYVCPESQRAENDQEYDTYYPQQKIADLLEASSCKNVFLVMDVCFGGKMFDKTEKHEYKNVNDGYNISPEEFIKRQLQIPCRQFLTSGGNNYVADGVAGNHSPFASRFLAALEDAAVTKDYITASEIMDYLRTMRTVGNDKKSFPRYGFFGGDKDGEFVIKVTKKIQKTAILASQ
jgi:tetratricopeptide (TPR) repeat protein